MSNLIGKDYLTLREVRERIDELESERDDFIEDFLDNEEHSSQEEADEAWLGTDEWDELDSLQSFAAEIENYVDESETLIHEDSFKEHAQQLADDIHDMNDNCWPFTCIDWDQAADELKMDYSSAELDGETYYYRD